jgi:hypothetical protein
LPSTDLVAVTISSIVIDSGQQLDHGQLDDRL